MGWLSSLLPFAGDVLGSFFGDPMLGHQIAGVRDLVRGDAPGALIDFGASFLGGGTNPFEMSLNSSGGAFGNPFSSSGGGGGGGNIFGNLFGGGGGGGGGLGGAMGPMNFNSAADSQMASLSGFDGSGDNPFNPASMGAGQTGAANSGLGNSLGGLRSFFGGGGGGGGGAGGGGGGYGGMAGNLAKTLGGAYGLSQMHKLQGQAGLPNPKDIQGIPGYQAGQDAVMRSMSAQGYQGSGNMMAAMSKYGGDFYNNYAQQRQNSAQGQANLTGQGMSSLFPFMSGMSGLMGGN